MSSASSIRWELSTGGAERLPLAAEGDRAGGHCTGSQFLDQTCGGKLRQCCSPQEDRAQFSRRQVEIGTGLRALTRDRVAISLQSVAPAVPRAEGILDLEDHVERYGVPARCQCPVDGSATTQHMPVVSPPLTP